MIISGKELSAKLKLEMADEVKTFPAKYGRVPHLVVILVGEDPGSVSYVTGKAKASAEVGIRNTTIRKPESVTEAELLDIIAALNLDDEVDGILVQLPLPKHIDEDKVIAAIDKSKDVDGFHPLNVAALWQKQPCTLPCTPKGILKMLRAAGVEIAGKRAVVIGRSNIVASRLETAARCERHGDDGPQPYARPGRSDARGGDSGGGHRASEVRHRRHGVGGNCGDRRGCQPRSGDGQAVRRCRFRGHRTQSFGHYPRSGRCRADDDLLPDGEYHRMLLKFPVIPAHLPYILQIPEWDVR